ncbi:MAG TPA: hypothetical protein H9824_07825 [Candidatus Bacteroides pullicola]|uniref:DUF5056 domain-containing protein n=1 Tax=Candidatus Bacteroides pullicola TaxID=2838475 RepID=A0A9D1ZJE6_9BACE|nr:hypothetical protein [Candidatus Bacteroides pullicola]
MNQPKDNALREALREETDFRLSPNFCSRTLQRVEKLARKRRRQQERRLFWVTVAASVALAAGCAVTLYICCGHTLWQAFKAMADSFRELDLFPYLNIGLLTLLLLGFDLGMRHCYHVWKSRRKG